MRFGTGIAVKSMVTYREWLRVAEDAGFDLLMTGDSQSLWADPFVALTLAAEMTTRPRLAITVSNPMTRHPAVVASASLAIQQLSGGRFSYGISGGDSAIRNIGVRPGRLDEIEEFVLAVRDATSGREASWKGTQFRVRWHEARVPIWMAAEGPRTQELAGRIADGVILSNALTPEVIAIAKRNIARGAEAAGRDVNDIELWWMCNLIPAETESAGIDSILPILAGTANHVYRFHMEDKAVPPDRQEAIRAVQSQYDSSKHLNVAAAAANGALVDRYGLRDFLAPRSTIAGPPDNILKRLNEVNDAGATNLLLSQFVPDQLAFMRFFADEIMPGAPR